MVFPVVTYECESWTVKKAECRRFHAFELWRWRRLLRVPWTARWSNQLTLKEISPEYSLKGLILAEAPVLWPPGGKTLRQEKKAMIEDEMVGWHHWLDGHEFEEALGVGDGQGSLAYYSPWGHRESDTIEWLNWTEKRRGCWQQEIQVEKSRRWQEILGWGQEINNKERCYLQQG